MCQRCLIPTGCFSCGVPLIVFCYSSVGSIHPMALWNGIWGKLLPLSHTEINSPLIWDVGYFVRPLSDAPHSRRCRGRQPDTTKKVLLGSCHRLLWIKAAVSAFHAAQGSSLSPSTLENSPFTVLMGKSGREEICGFGFQTNGKVPLCFMAMGRRLVSQRSIWKRAKVFFHLMQRCNLMITLQISDFIAVSIQLLLSVSH